MGIEPTFQLVTGTSGLKPGGPTRCPSASVYVNRGRAPRFSGANVADGVVVSSESQSVCASARVSRITAVVSTPASSIAV